MEGKQHERDGISKKTRTFKKYIGKRTRKLVIMGLIVAGTWRRCNAFGFAPTQRYEMRQGIVHVPGKKKQASLTMYLKMNDLEVQHELFVRNLARVGTHSEDMYMA